MTKIKFLDKVDVNKFCKENNLTYLGIFGSYARGEQNDTSDIDLLFEVDDTVKVTLFGVGKMAYVLEKELGINVDFIDKKNIKPEFKSSITNDLITLYEKR